MTWWRRWLQRGRSGAPAAAWTPWVDLIEAAPDPLSAALTSAAEHAVGVYLGMLDSGAAVFAKSELATLVIGPPRSGKTSGLVIPTLLLHRGPAVVTSTKDEVARATVLARYRQGRVRVFDPSGEMSRDQLPRQVGLLRWSPLQSARAGWLQATKMARAMTAAAAPAGASREHESYWVQRSAHLLAALLYAASRPTPTGPTLHMGDVVSWVATGALAHPVDLLVAAGKRGDRDATRALEQLQSVLGAPEKERGSIISATYATLDAYNSGAAVRASTAPTFDAAAFVRSGDTIYVTASSEDQAAVAPLVTGLLQDIRRAAFERHRQLSQLPASERATPVPVLMLLDEVANIAPIEDLPELVSEAGGQGLRIMAVLQTLPQAAARWGKDRAYGMLSTFGHVVVLSGTRDPDTLQTISTLLGEERRYVPSVAQQVRPAPGAAATQITWALQDFPVASPAEISRMPADQALVFGPGGHGTVRLTRYFEHRPWPHLLDRVIARGWVTPYREPAATAAAAVQPTAPADNGHGDGVERDL